MTCKEKGEKGKEERGVGTERRVSKRGRRRGEKMERGKTISSTTIKILT